MSLFHTLSWLWGFLIMFSSVSIRICAAQQCLADHFTQVDPTGHDAWVAGYTRSSLDGHSNAGSNDIFLMKFQVTGLKVERWVVGALSLEPSGQLLHASSGPVQTRKDTTSVWVWGCLADLRSEVHPPYRVEDMRRIHPDPSQPKVYTHTSVWPIVALPKQRGGEIKHCAHR